MRRVVEIGLLVLAIASVCAPAAIAQGEDQPQDDTPPLIVYTRYPSIEVGIGDDVSFNLELVAYGSPRRVGLSAEDLPEGWTATFRGSGDVIRAAYVEAGDDRSVDLRVEPPQDVAPGTYTFQVVASDEEVRSELPIEVTIKESLPPRLEMDVELPTLRGTTNTTFSYSATIENKGDEDVSVTLTANAPSAFRVTFKVTGREVTTVPITADDSERVQIDAQPLGNVAAGTYSIDVLAQAGDAEAATTLTAEVIGQAELSLGTPDGRLSGQARAGERTPFRFVLTNNGSAAARSVEMSASPPSGWVVEFEPERIDQIASGEEVEVTAHVQTGDQTIAGDYVMTVRARPLEETSESLEFRITVLTSTLWGVVGVAIIAVAVGVVALVVMRFGRR